MNQTITNDTRRAVVELLKDNRKALQACNRIAKMNFEKPFIVARSVGKFTVKSVKDTVSFHGISEPWTAVVLFRDNRRIANDKLHAVTISSRTNKFDEMKNVRGLYDFQIDTFWGVGVFNEARKACGGYVYIVAQAVEHLNDEPAPRTVKYLDALKNGERFRNPVVKYGSTYVTRIDGKGERIEAFPRGRFGYDDLTRIGNDCLRTCAVDKSGYTALPALIDRKQRARKLRAEREAEKAASFDCSAAENTITARLELLRADVMAWVANYNGTVKNYLEYRIMDNFVNAVYEFAQHKERRAAGKYRNIAEIETRLGYVEKYIDAATNIMHPKTESDETTAA